MTLDTALDGCMMHVVAACDTLCYITVCYRSFYRPNDWGRMVSLVNRQLTLPASLVQQCPQVR